jgi:hypothetical protein
LVIEWKIVFMKERLVMNRIFVALALLSGLFVGCGDSYRPPDREAETGDAAGPADTTGTQPGSVAAADGGEGKAATGDGAAPENGGGGEIQAGAIRLTAPAGWVRSPARSQFVAAEFQLPKAEGDERDGRLTVSVAGGSVDANLERWRGQFGGKPDKDTQDEIPIAGLTVTVVDLSGTYNDSMGPFAPGEQRPGYRMIGAVVPAGNQLHFIKAYGPEKTMEQHAAEFRAFLQTLQVDGQ